MNKKIIKTESGTGMNGLWRDLPPRLKQNPFFQFSEKTDCVPAWDRIELRHILPAIDYAITQQEKNIRAIVDNPAPPNFKNTVEALERADDLVNYFMAIAFNLMPGVNKQEKYEKIIDKTVDRTTDAFAAIFRDNTKLYERLLAVRQGRGFKHLSLEKKRLFELYENAFQEHGINLSPEKKQIAARLEKRIARLGLRSQNNMKMAQSSYALAIDEPEKLQGIPAFVIEDAAKEAAEQGRRGKWVLGLNEDTYEAVMQSAENRDLRRKLWRAYNTQGSHGRYDNRAVIIEYIKAQHEYAQLLGYRHSAAQIMAHNMIKDPSHISRFLRKMRKAALPVAKREIEFLRKYARQKDGVKLEPWDVPYYQERMKKELLGFTERELRPYFELENTVQGVFRHYKKIFGIDFKECKNYPAYHPDMRAFEVYKGSKKLGVVFMDLFARDEKPPGEAWSANVLGHGLFQGKVRGSIDVIVAKFTKGSPTLLSHYDVQTLFHELGHATHNLLSECRYNTLSGVEVTDDFLEFPSQFQENWPFQPEVLKDLGRHYKTGKPLPENLQLKILESRKFMAGNRVLTYAMKGWLDLAWHRANPANIRSVESFEKKTLAPYRLMRAHGTLISPHFSHIFGGGYDGEFPGYQLTQVMGADAFVPFQQQGLYNRSLAAEYRKIPEQGAIVSGDALFYGFRHRHWQPKSFLLQNGLIGEQFNYAAVLNPPAPANDRQPHSSTPRRRAGDMAYTPAA
jgi:peptidyl-dipeptidase Dcp